jgi:hypothetical protein
MNAVRAIEIISNELESAYSYLGALCRKDHDYLKQKLPYDDSWTILEHVEHIYLAGYFLLLTLEKSISKCLKRKKELHYSAEVGHLEKIKEISTPGLFPWHSPQHMIPNKKLPKAEIERKLQEQAVRLENLLCQVSDGSGTLCKVTMTVHKLGKIDVYQWAYFLTQHAKYHLKYILAIEGKS